LTDVITGIRQLLQDLIAPDLKAIHARQDAHQAKTDAQYNSLIAAIEAFRAEMRAEFTGLRASLQLEVLEKTHPLSERITALEAKQSR
jgi:hypothetical protein